MQPTSTLCWFSFSCCSRVRAVASLGSCAGFLLSSFSNRSISGTPLECGADPADPDLFTMTSLGTSHEHSACMSWLRTLRVFLLKSEIRDILKSELMATKDSKVCVAYLYRLLRNNWQCVLFTFAGETWSLWERATDSVCCIEVDVSTLYVN